MRVLAFMLALTVAGCAHRAPGVQQYDSSVITRDDIERTDAVTALDVVRRLRPQYLNSRGQSSLLLDPKTTPVVFLDAQPLGDVSQLDQVRVADLQEIHFFNGPQAVQKFGSRYGGGVIQLISRNQ